MGVRIESQGDSGGDLKREGIREILAESSADMNDEVDLEDFLKMGHSPLFFFLEKMIGTCYCVIISLYLYVFYSFRLIFIFIWV